MNKDLKKALEFFSSRLLKEDPPYSCIPPLGSHLEWEEFVILKPNELATLDPQVILEAYHKLKQDACFMPRVQS